MTKLLEEIELTRLSSLPHILIKLLSACHDDNACFDTLTEIVSEDAALSAKVISVANSPVYAKRCELTSIKQVLLFLGLDTIRSIAITASVQQFFSRYSKEKTQFLKSFWQHTLYTAVIARSLAKITSYHNPEEAYIAGLLHNIGQLIFESHAKQAYSEKVNELGNDETLLQYESDNYQITHDDIGARLLESWGLGVEICDAVKYHHAPIDNLNNTHQLVIIIRFASELASRLTSNSESIAEYDHRLIDISDSVLQELLKGAEDEVNKVATSLDIDIKDSESVDAKDESKQLQLAQDIRDITLVQNALQSPADHVQEFDYKAIYQSTFIVFNIRQSVLFLYDDEAACLKLEPHAEINNSPVLSGLEIDLNSKSVLAECLRSDVLAEIYANQNKQTTPVIDLQLINGLGTEGMICIPLKCQSAPVGVLVLGVSHAQAKIISAKKNLINIFAYEIVSWITRFKTRHASVSQLLEQKHLQTQAKAKEVIHEVNNPLAIINNYLHVLGGRLKENSAALNDINLIKDEINRVGDVILKCDSDLENIDAEDAVQKINVNDLIKSMNRIMASSLYLSNDIHVQLVLDDELADVVVNKNYLNQILTNLIKNAVEAMDDVRELVIATRNVNINGKAFIEMEVRDTGPGIAEEILQHLYEPVRSTKGNQNAGLGLSIVKNLLDEMSGTITCKSGKSGTSFCVQLPINNSGK